MEQKGKEEKREKGEKKAIEKGRRNTYVDRKENHKNIENSILFSECKRYTPSGQIPDYNVVHASKPNVNVKAVSLNRAAVTKNLSHCQQRNVYGSNSKLNICHLFPIPTYIHTYSYIVNRI